MTSLCFVVQLPDRTLIITKGIFFFFIGNTLPRNHWPYQWFSSYKKPAA